MRYYQAATYSPNVSDIARPVLIMPAKLLAQFRQAQCQYSRQKLATLQGVNSIIKICLYRLCREIPSSRCHSTLQQYQKFTRHSFYNSLILTRHGFNYISICIQLQLNTNLGNYSCNCNCIIL